jgi:3-methyl-2-oxobutanoate hydroxymethyltransferase
VSSRAKVTVAALAAKKRRGQKITMLTAYDYPLARFIHLAGVDVILVSDAVGTVGLGRSEAVSVTVEEMAYHTRACRNGAGQSMVVTTLPFGTYTTAAEAVRNATRLVKEGSADGVHIEGTDSDAGAVRAVVGAGIPVIAHVGIIKQKIVRSGAIRVQGRTASEASQVLRDALAMSEAGAFALVLECIPAPLAEVITRSLPIPTIGIGAGPACDGQALVTQDMLGLFKEISPRFLKVYADLERTIVDALAAFRQDVESGRFPGPEHTYSISEQELARLVASLRT